VVAHSKKVILVVNSGAGVNLTPWVGKVAAILQAWYPGQEGATALDEIISGDVNPSGKLPTSFPAKLAGTYYADAYPPVNHHVAYKEGLLTGYRWFDAKHQAPLFPFGFGLSYTTFKVSDTKAWVKGDELHVSASITNTGKKFGGAEVVQVYTGPKNPGPGEPVKRLKAFSRFDLATGSKAELDVIIPFDELATWDTPSHQWVVSPGRYVVYVGTSSRDVKAIEFDVTTGKHFDP
jgi:beta-glucosidase